MPYIRLELNQYLSDSERLTLAQKAADLVGSLPGKLASRTMVNIASNCDLYLNGQDRALAFVEVRMFNQAEQQDKTTLVERLFALLEGDYSIAREDAFMNVIELPSWGKNGSLSFSDNWMK